MKDREELIKWIDENIFNVTSLNNIGRGIIKIGLLNRFDKMQKKIDELEREVRRLAERDGNATIELCYTSKYTPFEREELTVVDFGHADNVYVVQSKIFKET